ncbi:MAG: hypothetical protein M5U28_25140 [Sandaracinaceae bacterium]|nr:hypothetical protein [Sandaracinaceae bacterium]
MKVLKLGPRRSISGCHSARVDPSWCTKTASGAAGSALRRSPTSVTPSSVSIRTSRGSGSGGGSAGGGGSGRAGAGSARAGWVRSAEQPSASNPATRINERMRPLL